MTIWITSDTHFYHKNILKYCLRPFKDEYHMNEILIKNWTECVKPGDIIYHLGDVCFQAKEKIDEVMPRLCMGKYSILQAGNHDQGKRHEMLEKYFDEVYDEPFTFVYKGKGFCMVHNPEEVKIENLLPGEYLLYGHVHDNAPTGYDKETRSFHVGVDTNDYRPVNLDEICRQIDEAEQNL